MKIKIITKKDFFSLNEKDIYKEEKINLILNKIKTKSHKKYEDYGKNTIIEYAKNVLLKNHFSNSIIEIKKDIFVKWEDFTQIIRFDNGKITYRFVGGLYDINLCDKSGLYLDKKLYGMLLSEFECEVFS
jgi:hypothetical protein